MNIEEFKEIARNFKVWEDALNDNQRVLDFMSSYKLLCENETQIFRSDEK